MSSLCISFQRSLDLLKLTDCAPYGVHEPDGSVVASCDTPWTVKEREFWLQMLADAQDTIERELGVPLCPQEICNELHTINCPIKLRYAPVAYLGQKVYSDWTTEPVVITNGEGVVEVCGIDTDVVTVDNIEFAYPEDVCRTGLQRLQTPCLEAITCEDLTDGIRATWPLCQLHSPDIDVSSETDTDDFLDEVRWRTWTIDESLAYTVVGECSCRVCGSGEIPTYTMTLSSDVLGELCIASDTCVNRNRRLFINYATAFNCGNGISPSLERAVVLLALLKAGPNRPCGCDAYDAQVNYWLADDSGRGIEAISDRQIERDFRYGISKAGMEVMRTLDNILKRPKPNEVPTTVKNALAIKGLKNRWQIR